MAKPRTRRQLLFTIAGMAGGGVVALVGGKAMGKTIREIRPELIHSAIHRQIDRAGWKGAKPEIYGAQDEKGAYVTGPLPVVGGCFVTLIFHDDMASHYGVRDYTTPKHDIIVHVVGLDGKTYPGMLTSLGNPTKAQINTLLTNAGLHNLPS